MADYQVTLRTLTMGAGTDFDIGEDGIGGLGVPGTKTADTNLAHANGAVGAADYMDVRVVTVPLVWGGTGANDVLANLGLLNEAWAPSVTDLVLTIGLGGETLNLTGRPRGLTEDLRDIAKGEGAALGTFVALDPVFS